MKKRAFVIEADDKVIFDNKCIGKHTKRGMYLGCCTGKELVDMIEKDFDDHHDKCEKLLVQISNLKHALMDCLEDDEARNRIVSLIAKPKEYPRNEEWM